MRRMPTFHAPQHPGLVVHDGGRPALTFYGGIFETDEPKEIALLERVPEVVEIDPDEHPELIERYRRLLQDALPRERRIV